MNNPRPVMSIRKTIQLMVILTLLAWATQTLFAQWGRGGLILPAPPAQTPQNDASSNTAPAPAPAAAPVRHIRGGAVIELQPRAIFPGEGKIALRDVCKWSDYDAPIMQPYADLLIAKIGVGPRIRQVTVDDIKSRLHDAGANLAVLQFTGSAECRILVGDEKDSDNSTENTPIQPVAEIAPPTTQPQVEEAAAPAVAATPAPIIEEQLILTRPLSRGQRIIASDIEIKRIQLDAPTTRPAIARDEIIGNIAARDLKKGEIFEPSFIARPPVVIKGQFMTVAMRIGEFDVETVARAMNDAAIGEIVRAKNEANGDVYRVIVTAANEGRVQSSSNDGNGIAAVVPAAAAN